MIKLLQILFKDSTRSVQVFNLIINTVWIILLGFHLTNHIILDIPERMQEHIDILMLGSIIVEFLSIIGFYSTGYKHQLFKSSALLINSLLQSIVASFYASAYPPFEMIVLVNVSFALWFLGAVLYIVKVEGMRENGIT